MGKKTKNMKWLLFALVVVAVIARTPYTGPTLAKKEMKMLKKEKHDDANLTASLREFGNKSMKYFTERMEKLKKMKAKLQTNTTGFPGVFGLDISVSLSKSFSRDAWSCIHTTGNYDFAIIEGFQGGYGLNTYLPTAVADAHSGGFSHVDTYAFMCPRCAGNGIGAVTNLVQFVKSKSVDIGMYWIDVEQCSGCWNSAGDNCAWIKSLANQYGVLGANVGIYSSPYEWSATVGGCSGLENHPVWYAHYDGEPNFNDWPSVRFGGWGKPSIKQFDDKAGNSCGKSIDRDWYP